MKLALVLEKDFATSKKTCQLVELLGYKSAAVWTADQALNVTRAIKFHLIVTCTTRKENDQRSLIGELKRITPQAALVLITENGEQNSSSAHTYLGISAVIGRPPSVDALRRIVEFGIDGCGLQPNGVPKEYERRNNLK
jgi:DNA-binding NtrC family response regulator